MDRPLFWVLVGALSGGLGWLAFEQGAAALQFGIVNDPQVVPTVAPVFGAILGAFLFTWRSARIESQTTIATPGVGRRLSLVIFTCGMLLLALIRVYRVRGMGSDAAPTVGFGIAWALIGALIGQFIGDKVRFENLLRKHRSKD